MLHVKKYMAKIGFIRDRDRIRHRIIFNVLYWLSHPLLCKYLYHRVMGKKLNLKDPSDFNEKLQWLKLYWQNSLIVKCTDKYEVREYVESCGCKEILNELYGVYENVSQIDWDRLPQKFALKATHGCACNIICSDKDSLDKDEAISKLNKWLKTDYSRIAAEFHYAKIKPRLICEKYIGSESGRLPIDYKIFCFNGKPKFVLVCTEREYNLHLIFLDLNYNILDISYEKYNKDDVPEQPKCFDDMIKYSEKLSKPFPFVRVDFYDYNDTLIFGELTFTPVAGLITCFNEYGSKLLGDMLELPDKCRFK